jgi:hypothetical protein
VPQQDFLDRQFVQIQFADVATINAARKDKIVVQDRYAAYATLDTSTVFPAFGTQLDLTTGTPRPFS